MIIKFLKKFIKFIIFDDYRTNYFVNKYYKISSDDLFCNLYKKLIKRQLKIKKFIILGGNSKVGHNIQLPHPMDVVIGDYAIIGNNCKLYHGVTLGQNRGKFPKLGNNLIIYSGAKIIGDVHIGDNSVIGANSVVTNDMPSDSIIVGSPARVIRKRTNKDEFY